MKKKINIIKTGVLVATTFCALAANAFPFSSNAKVMAADSINGHIEVVTKLRSDEKSWLESKFNELEVKSPKISKQDEKNFIKENKETDKNVFTHEITVPMPFVEIKIDSQDVKADDKGNFTLKPLQPGNYTAQVFSEDHLFMEVPVTVKEGADNVLISFTTDLQQVSENMDRKMNMHTDLENSQGVITNSESSTTADSLGITTVEPSAVTADFPPVYGPYIVGNYYGYNLGKMRILTTATHVNCNKSDGDYGGNFPANNSDCSQGIAAGYLYASDPTTYRSYQSGLYCLQEGMGQDTRDGNIYCNGKTNTNTGTNKPKLNYYTGGGNLGYNCSSFPFLNHSEKLHWTN